jgi:hypothetical protein
VVLTITDRHTLAVVTGNCGDDFIGRPEIGDLVQTTAGTWIIRRPSRCPNGHEFGPNKALVGYQACLGHGGGHTTWTCRQCDETVYGPPLNTHCTTLDGPATVRISTASKRS